MRALIGMNQEEFLALRGPLPASLKRKRRRASDGGVKGVLDILEETLGRKCVLPQWRRQRRGVPPALSGA